MTKYYFVRHGESTANAAALLAGWSDYPLTGRGIEQAAEAAQSIKAAGIEFDTIMSSPLSRALQTARIIAEINGYPEDSVKIVDDLKGGSGGDLEGLPYKHWYATPEEEIASVHGGEDAKLLRVRIGRAIVRIVETTIDADNVLLVAHASIYQMIRAIYDGVEPATEAYKVTNARNGEFVEMGLADTTSINCDHQFE